MPQLQCEEIRFPSADGVHTVAASMYTMPGVPVRAVLQLSHGMCEYVQRYRPMAQWYAQRGIALAGNDHLGHGGTANKGEHGHYGEPRGRYHLLNDLHTMNGIIHQKFPGVPVFLYGHSMGSFYARWYAETWPETSSLLSPVTPMAWKNSTAGFFLSPSAANRMIIPLRPLLWRLAFANFNP